MKNQFLLSEAAAQIGCRGYQIQYAINQGYVADVDERMNHQRLFTPKDIERFKKYFASKPKQVSHPAAKKEAHAK